jgi:translation machinery-associated protein 16
LISEVYLTRHDDRIAELTAERRAGRPKDKELLDLEELRRKEWAEWETGIGESAAYHSHILLHLNSQSLLLNQHYCLIQRIYITSNTADTPIEVPDLTHAPTSRLLYELQTSETNLQPSHVDLLRQIRLIKDDAERVIVSKQGRTGNMGLTGPLSGEVGDSDWTALGASKDDEGGDKGMAIEA